MLSGRVPARDVTATLATSACHPYSLSPSKAIHNFPGFCPPYQLLAAVVPASSPLFTSFPGPLVSFPKVSWVADPSFQPVLE